MIVDDEPYNHLALTIIIKQSGYENILQLIDKANDGLQALELVKSGFQKKEYSYGLIFMDCSMPIMNGYEATSAIRNYIENKHI